LLNTNESATVAKIKKNCDLNKVPFLYGSPRYGDA
jgi:hypothetical protein